MPFKFNFEKHALDNFLKTVNFPASKHSLIDLASKANIPSTVLTMLQGLPDKDFKSADEVHQVMPAKAA